MLDRTKSDALALAPLDLNALLLRIFEATEPSLEAHGVRLVTDLLPGLPPLSGDADRLQQVFINLINNALDAMPDGGELRVRTGLMAAGSAEAQPKPSVSGDSGEARIYVELADSGCGMSEEIRSRIFDPFYTTKTVGHGGLGLVVVRQVVREHGGSIQVESAEGRGARFFIELPSVARPQSDTPADVLVEA